MKKEKITLTSEILLVLLAADNFLATWLNPYKLRKRASFGKFDSYRATIHKLQKRGWIEVVNKDSQKFIRLTKKGEIEALLAKITLPVKEKWDKKWRVVIYDIPEESKEKRYMLRFLLKKKNFQKLQASVYVTPFPINREAVSYLQKTGLMDFIRIMKVEEMDSDKDLRKKFNL